MIQALKLKQMVEEWLVHYRSIFGRKKKQKTQRSRCFHKVTPCVPASPAFPSISFTSASPETARRTPPFPLPPQSTQHEDKHENLHDDPHPL